MRAIALVTALAIFFCHQIAEAQQVKPHTASTACTAGTPCPGDTANAAIIVKAVGDADTESRIFGLWVGQCALIQSEAGTAIGHTFRVAFCNAIAAGKVPLSTLVWSVMNSTVQAEILAASSYPPYAGEMVNADVNSAIDAALTVGDANATPSVTVANQSNVLTLSSGTGVVPGQIISCSAPGISAGTVVQTIFSSGGTAYAIMSSPATAAITSPAPCSFDLYSGLAVRPWG